MQYQYSKNTHDVTKCSEGTRSCGAPKRARWLCFHSAHSALALFIVDCSLYDWFTATNYSARPVHYSRRFLSPPLAPFSHDPPPQSRSILNLGMGLTDSALDRGARRPDGSAPIIHQPHSSLSAPFACWLTHFVR